MLIYGTSYNADTITDTKSVWYIFMAHSTGANDRRFARGTSKVGREQMLHVKVIC